MCLTITMSAQKQFVEPWWSVHYNQVRSTSSTLSLGRITFQYFNNFFWTIVRLLAGLPLVSLFLNIKRYIRSLNASVKGLYLCSCSCLLVQATGTDHCNHWLSVFLSLFIWTKIILFPCDECLRHPTAQIWPLQEVWRQNK